MSELRADIRFVKNEMQMLIEVTLLLSYFLKPNYRGYLIVWCFAGNIVLIDRFGISRVFGNKEFPDKSPFIYVSLLLRTGTDQSLMCLCRATDDTLTSMRCGQYD